MTCISITSTIDLGQTPALRVLSLLAHPDDAEFLCAGTLALLAQRGWFVTIATASPGDCGSAELPAEAIAGIRRREAAEAARLIGGDYLCLEERDLAIDYNTASRRRFVEAFRAVRPDVVLTHPLVDYMADHEIVGRLARDACFAAPMPNFAGTGGAPPLERIPYLYACAPFFPEEAGRDSSDRATVIDVASTMEIKQRMLACHASQREWLRRQHGVDEYMRLQEEFARESGLERGFAYAERFEQYTRHPYPQDDLLTRTLQ